MTAEVPFLISINNSNWYTFYHPKKNYYNLAHGIDLAIHPYLKDYYNDAPNASNTLNLLIPNNPAPGVNFFLADGETGLINLYRVYETKPCCPTIMSSAGSGGSISPTPGPFTIPTQGRTFDMTANGGSQLSNVTVDGTSKGTSDPYNVQMSDLNMGLGMEGHTISASFTPDQTIYTITMGTSSDGWTQPSGNLYKHYNDQFTINADPNQYHVFDHWTTTYGNAILANAYSRSTTLTVHGSDTVTPIFANKTQIYITATADGGAWISPGSGYYSTGTAHTFYYGANYGYDVTGVYVDGNSVSITGSYTFQSPWEDHTLSVVTTPRASVSFSTRDWGNQELNYPVYIDSNYYQCPTTPLLSVGTHNVSFYCEPGYIAIDHIDFHHDGTVDTYWGPYGYVGDVYLENGDYFVAYYTYWGY